eukprot:TRINITY_DN66166_c5_g12_i2.p2 TRINITY_DN66166_c5_g12~~TRINITY_DN66166_c5_g12_i2.p2  ORF type:complete len:613 (-),score=124.03 TRINITY_DN66166_c5_g12_i2:2425-4137(-)
MGNDDATLPLETTTDNTNDHDETNNNITPNNNNNTCPLLTGTTTAQSHSSLVTCYDSDAQYFLFYVCLIALRFWAHHQQSTRQRGRGSCLLLLGFRCPMTTTSNTPLTPAGAAVVHRLTDPLPPDNNSLVYDETENHVTPVTDTNTPPPYHEEEFINGNNGEALTSFRNSSFSDDGSSSPSSSNVSLSSSSFSSYDAYGDSDDDEGYLSADSSSVELSTNNNNRAQEQQQEEEGEEEEDPTEGGEENSSVGSSKKDKSKSQTPSLTSTQLKKLQKRRDYGHWGLRLVDFWRMKESRAARLTKNEVAALRIFTGPSHDTLNRDLIASEGKFAKFPVTLRNLSSGIFKLMEVTKAQTLYRIIRGKLPFHFEQIFAKGTANGYSKNEDIWQGMFWSGGGTEFAVTSALGSLTDEAKKGGDIILEMPNALGASIKFLAQYSVGGAEEFLLPPNTLFLTSLMNADQIDREQELGRTVEESHNYPFQYCDIHIFKALHIKPTKPLKVHPIFPTTEGYEWLSRKCLPNYNFASEALYDEKKVAEQWRKYVCFFPHLSGAASTMGKSLLTALERNKWM